MKKLRNLFDAFLGNFVVIILLASSVTLFTMFMNLADTVQNLSKSLIRDRLNLTKQELSNIFIPVQNVLKISKEWGENGLLPDIRDYQKLNNLFIPFLKSSKAVSSVLIADENGDEYLLLKEDSLWMNRITYKSSKTANPESYYWKETDSLKNELVSKKTQTAPYDPLTRPWYINAVKENLRNEISWTDPYTFYTTEESGITASVKLKNSGIGNNQVIAMDILLADLSEFTTNINITSNGKIFILTEQNRVLGLPKDPRFTDRKSRNKYELKTLKELNIPLLNEAVRVYNSDIESKQFRFTFNHMKWWAGIETYNLNSDKKLYIGAVVPETDFINEIEKTRTLIYGGFVLLFLFFVFIIYSFDRLKKAKKIIALERDKNEKLLLNTLPSKVVNELKENGVSEPQKFKDVTVFFSDIVGFTESSAKLDPKKLIEELNEIYSAFDDIMEKHGSERIKTIGDAYLAVCGMPVKNDQHAEKMLSAAAEIIDYIAARNNQSAYTWHIRIGMHTGNVVGGIVGVKKYIYDVFGDTINTASRMEQFSEPGRINLSEETYQLVKDSAFLLKENFFFERRKPMFVKGKGETIMYFATKQSSARGK